MRTDLQHSIRTIVTGLVGLSCATGALSAQAGGAWKTLHKLEVQDHGSLGEAVAAAGDVNADGVPDVIAGAPWDDYQNGIYRGSAFVFSGADGSLIHEYLGPPEGMLFGRAVAGAGDTNGDGHSDYLVASSALEVAGMASAGSVFLYSGKDGSLLRRFDGSAAGDDVGHAVAGVGDVNGDGFDDVMFSAIGVEQGGAPWGGAVFVHSGVDGSLIFRFDGTAGSVLGSAVASAGDVNADGVPDLVVGAYGVDLPGLLDAGIALVFSGADGSQLLRLDGREVDGAFGGAVDGVGDLDGDGHDDLIVGAWGVDFARGAAYVFSGRTGQLLYQYDGPFQGSEFGEGVAGAGDLDGDGSPDFLIGAPWDGWFSSGLVWAYSGANGSVMHEIDLAGAFDFSGEDLDSLGDVDGDGLSDAVISSHGAAWVGGVDPFLGASARSLSAAAGGRVDFTLDFPRSEFGKDYALLASQAGTGPLLVNGVAIPLSPDWLFSALAAGSAPSVLQQAYGTLDGDGNAAAVLDLPPGAASAYAGSSFWFAAVSYVPPKSVALSSVAVEIEVLP